jgi:pentatricopeptide repeat protein
MRPDEGTCLSVLNAAGKQGNTQLATDVIRQLSTSGFIYKEHYFTPLMEAFANKGDLKSAFNVLDIMRVSGIQPSMRSTLPIRRKLYKDIDAIDKAYYILEEMHKEGKAVDLTAFNVIIGACADAGDIERTVATYREAPHLGVQPNVDTYNTVLEACVKTRMQGMGNIVIKEMLSNNIKPNLETYSRMISLACTQKSYEDAFTYLEEMKGYDIVPPESCYTTLARKLASEKDPRFHLALEEMETFGYKVTPKVRGLWK